MEQLTQVSGTPLGVGTQLGDYVIEQLLGAGTEGAVYRARDIVLGRRVALKTVRDGSSAHTRCVEEARLMARVEHPNVLRVYHAQRHHRIWYVALEYAGCGSVHARAKTLGALGVREALGLLAQAADGLAHLHGLGILHRDVKPQNMLLTTDGQLKVSDFGLSTELRGDECRAPGMIGTPAFLAPERWEEGPLAAAGDVYSLGVSLFYLLTGQLPFPSKSSDELRRAHARLEPRLPESTPRGVREVVMAMMAKSPDARPRLDTALCSELRRLREVPKSSLRCVSIGAFPATAWTSRDNRASRVARELESYREECSRALERDGRCVVFTSDANVLESFWNEVVSRLGPACPLLTRIRLGPGALAPLAQLRERSGMNDGGAPGLALTSLLERNGQASSGVVEVYCDGAAPRAHLLEVVELAQVASTSAVKVCCLSTDVERAEDPVWERFVRVRLPSRGTLLTELVQAWSLDATGGQFRLSSDALRVLSSATAHEQRPWVGILERSIAIAGANDQHLVPSWAVFRALKATARIEDISDVPAELRRRPASWPPGDVFELLMKLRNAAADWEVEHSTAEMTNEARCWGMN